MKRLFLFAIVGVFLGGLQPTVGTVPNDDLSPAPVITSKVANKANGTLANPRNGNTKTNTATNTSTDTQKNTKTNGKAAKNPSSKEIQKPNTAAVDTTSKPPSELRPLTKKTIVIDARRLDGQKFTDTIRWIKDNPNVRLKLTNTTINPEDALKILKLLKESGVIDQIRDIGFVMLPGGSQNLLLNEKAFSTNVFPYLGHLEAIEFSCLGVSDQFIASLPKSLPHLKSISLFGVGITDKTVEALAEGLPFLNKLHLINTSITSKSIPNLVKKFPYLKALGISGRHFKDADYLALREGLAKILSFSVVGQEFKNADVIRDLLIAMPQLHTLDLSQSTANDKTAKAITEIGRKVQILNISETRITFAGIQDIVKSRDLIKLKMDNLSAIGDDELRFITDSQPGLKVFHFAGAYFTEATIMTMILKLPKLMDVTFVPAKESTWMLTEGIEKALSLKREKLQYLHIEAKRLPEKLRLELEKDLPRLRIEYAIPMK